MTAAVNELKQDAAAKHPGAKSRGKVSQSANPFTVSPIRELVGGTATTGPIERTPKESPHGMLDNNKINGPVGTAAIGGRPMVQSPRGLLHATLTAQRGTPDVAQKKINGPVDGSDGTAGGGGSLNAANPTQRAMRDTPFWTRPTFDGTVAKGGQLEDRTNRTPNGPKPEGKTTKTKIVLESSSEDDDDESTIESSDDEYEQYDDEGDQGEPQEASLGEEATTVPKKRETTSHAQAVLGNAEAYHRTSFGRLKESLQCRLTSAKPKFVSKYVETTTRLFNAVSEMRGRRFADFVAKKYDTSVLNEKELRVAAAMTHTHFLNSTKAQLILLPVMEIGTKSFMDIDKDVHKMMVSKVGGLSQKKQEEWEKIVAESDAAFRQLKKTSSCNLQEMELMVPVYQLALKWWLTKRADVDTEGTGRKSLNPKQTKRLQSAILASSGTKVGIFEFMQGVDDDDDDDVQPAKKNGEVKVRKTARSAPRGRRAGKWNDGVESSEGDNPAPRKRSVAEAPPLKDPRKEWPGLNRFNKGVRCWACTAVHVGRDGLTIKAEECPDKTARDKWIAAGRTHPMDKTSHFS